uniref:Reverse transcriptase Ty1/copia-type domain-containing protein n=1 Tax=Tanacetum cinerariifolium TaxID=118510 RepID=A0A6L2NU27_TANCI|nr:hypothetical protein [Tanacetum cinerariifolium]
MSSEVLSMFTDVSYPLSVKLIERMLMHKLEIHLDVVGNDMTTSEQLIQFIKNQLATAQASPTYSLICADFSRILFKNQSSRYVVPTGRVIVPTGRYVVPTGRVIVATGRYVVPAVKIYLEWDPTDGDMCMYALTMSTMKPKNVKEAMTDPAWIESIQEKLFHFKRMDIWVLVPAPDNISPLTLKWIFKNKNDEENTVIRNKSRLVVRGTIDPTLFIRRFDNDILVVQIYVDDIIFGSTHPRYTQLFFDLMKSRFEMSMMGEMTFFLGLQVNQSPCGIFINQSNYVLEILKKYGIESCDPVGTLIEIKDKLDLDQNGTLVDATKYHSMIGALIYLTSSRPDIVHATCLCARYQAKPIEKHLKEMLITRGCKDTFKSTSGGAQFLGEKLLTDYGFHFNKIPIYYDSKSSIAISCNPVQHSRTKHIAIRYHFIKEHVEKGTIELYFVKTDYQLADLFTKSLPADRFNYLVRRLGMRSLSPQELDRLAKSQ